MFPQDNLSNWHNGKGSWSNIEDSHWFDWKWQMRNRLSTISDFQQHLNLSNEEVSGFKAAVDKLSVSVTPYFFNLINKTDPNCPIRRQVIPLGDESNVSPEEMIDPVGEENTMPVPVSYTAILIGFYFWLLIAVHLIVGIALEVEWFQTLRVMVLVHHLMQG